MRFGRIGIVAMSALLLVAAGRTTPSAWFGTWHLRLGSAAETPETLIYSDAGRGAMRMRSVELNSELITQLDGTPSKQIRSDPAHPFTIAIRAVSPTRYTWIFKRPGKPDVLGDNVLANDRMSFTERSWLVTDPGKVVTLVYQRRR